MVLKWATTAGAGRNARGDQRAVDVHAVQGQPGGREELLAQGAQAGVLVRPGEHQVAHPTRVAAVHGAQARADQEPELLVRTHPDRHLWDDPGPAPVGTDGLRGSSVSRLTATRMPSEDRRRDRIGRHPRLSNVLGEQVHAGLVRVLHDPVVRRPPRGWRRRLSCAPRHRRTPSWRWSACRCSRPRRVHGRCSAIDRRTTPRPARRRAGPATRADTRDRVVPDVVGDRAQDLDVRREAGARVCAAPCRRARPSHRSHCRWLAIEAEPPLPHTNTAASRSYASASTLDARSNAARSTVAIAWPSSRRSARRRGRPTRTGAGGRSPSGRTSVRTRARRECGPPQWRGPAPRPRSGRLPRGRSGRPARPRCGPTPHRCRGPRRPTSGKGRSRAGARRRAPCRDLASGRSSSARTRRRRRPGDRGRRARRPTWASCSASSRSRCVCTARTSAIS